MNKYILLFSIVFNTSFLYASETDDHNHKEHNHSASHEKHSDHEEHDEHGEESHEKHDGHDDHGHGGGKAIGKGKAIEDVDEKKGFKLSKESIKTLKLKLQTVDRDEFEISKETLVTSKVLKGIYRFRAGYFKFLPLKLIKEVNGKYLVKVKGVDFGDQIVTNGVGLLRVTDVYSTDKSEYGHSH